ncbi:hypothetical protein ONZ45_g9715 [Pleurotus djamor]|nr:hypothetical protein ONZ45_g9715 [Pleurotus djamor]
MSRTPRIPRIRNATSRALESTEPSYAPIRQNLLNRNEEAGRQSRVNRNQSAANDEDSTSDEDYVPSISSSQVSVDQGQDDPLFLPDEEDQPVLPQVEQYFLARIQYDNQAFQEHLDKISSLMEGLDTRITTEGHHTQTAQHQAPPSQATVVGAASVPRAAEEPLEPVDYFVMFVEWRGGSVRQKVAFQFQSDHWIFIPAQEVLEKMFRSREYSNVTAVDRRLQLAYALRPQEDLSSKPEGFRTLGSIEECLTMPPHRQLISTLKTSVELDTFRERYRVRSWVEVCMVYAYDAVPFSVLEVPDILTSNASVPGHTPPLPPPSPPLPVVNDSENARLTLREAIADRFRKEAGEAQCIYQFQPGFQQVRMTELVKRVAIGVGILWGRSLGNATFHWGNYTGTVYDIYAALCTGTIVAQNTFANYRTLHKQVSEALATAEPLYRANRLSPAGTHAYQTLSVLLQENLPGLMKTSEEATASNFTMDDIRRYVQSVGAASSEASSSV